jgi:hypothetical protein
MSRLPKSVQAIRNRDSEILSTHNTQYSLLIYNAALMWKAIIVVAGMLIATSAAQQAAPKQNPPVKLTVLNICTPSDDEQKEIATALASIPRQPRFATDFEVARGHSTVVGVASDWVRIRRDFAGGPFGVGQFLFSGEGQTSRETVVLVSREAKGVTQIALEDKTTAPVTPSSLLSTDTPVDRISLERFGKSHLVLARCTEADQSKYESLFKTASEIMATYRAASGAREIVPAEMGRLSLGVGPGYRAPKVKPMGKR